jgi:hypothetical protein
MGFTNRDAPKKFILLFQ